MIHVAAREHGKGPGGSGIKTVRPYDSLNRTRAANPQRKRLERANMRIRAVNSKPRVTPFDTSNEGISLKQRHGQTGLFYCPLKLKALLRTTGSPKRRSCSCDASCDASWPCVRWQVALRLPWLQPELRALQREPKLVRTQQRKTERRAMQQRVAFSWR